MVALEHIEKDNDDTIWALFVRNIRVPLVNRYCNVLRTDTGACSVIPSTPGF